MRIHQLVEEYGLCLLQSSQAVNVERGIATSEVMALPTFVCGLSGSVVVPGTFTLEVMCQTAALAVLYCLAQGSSVTMTRIDRTRFIRSVQIGSMIKSCAKVKFPQVSAKQWKVETTAFAARRVAATALIVFHQK